MLIVVVKDVSLDVHAWEGRGGSCRSYAKKIGGSYAKSPRA